MDTGPEQCRLAIVCVAYAPGPELGRALASLPAATSQPYRAVVVDNTPPTLESTAPQQAEQAGVAYLPCPDNPGYGEGMNRGAAYLLGQGECADAEYLVVLNPDVVLLPGVLDRLARALERNPRAGIAGPRLLDQSGHNYPTGRKFPSLRLALGHALFGAFWPNNPWTRAYHGPGLGARRLSRVDWLSGACLVIRRQTWDELAGFDPGYFMFFEDVDLGWRAARRGWASLLVPGAVVEHLQGTSWKADPLPMRKAHHQSARVFLSRYYAGWAYLPVRMLIGPLLKIRLGAEILVRKIAQKFGGKTGEA